jgi:hypothetical protein
LIRSLAVSTLVTDERVIARFASMPTSIPGSVYWVSDGIVFVMVPLPVIRMRGSSSPAWRVATVLLERWGR